MTVVVAGGTGFIGSAVVTRLVEAGRRVVVLSRNPERFRNGLHPSLQFTPWDGRTMGPWTSSVEGAEAVINLVGEPIAVKRWTDAQKRRISSSRLDATRAIVEAIRHASAKPSVLVNASAVGFYGDTGDDLVDEDRPKGSGFLADLCERWEHEAKKVETLGLRSVLLRFGVVLGENGGALQKLLPPFKWFIGGPIGTGKQWLPWIHREDVLRVILFALEQPAVSGPVNVVAPDPVTMREFCDALGRALNRPSWLPIPGFALRIAFAEIADMLLTGQRLVPSVLHRAGYSFRYPNLLTALESLVH